MTRYRPSLLIALLLTLCAVALAAALVTQPSQGRSRELLELEHLGGSGGGVLQIDELGVSTTISSHEFSVTNTTVSGGGSGTGKATFSPLKVKKVIDSASPLLMNSVATGVHIPTAVVTVYKPGTTRALGVYELEEVVVTGVEQSGAKGSSETVSLSYRTVTFTAGGESWCFDLVSSTGC